MGFATEVTAEEAAQGFERVEHMVHGVMVVLRIGNGLRAVKTTDASGVRYTICDDALIVLYTPARSLFELRSRFDLGSKRAG